MTYTGIKAVNNFKDGKYIRSAANALLTIGIPVLTYSNYKGHKDYMKRDNDIIDKIESGKEPYFKVQDTPTSKVQRYYIANHDKYSVQDYIDWSEATRDVIPKVEKVYKK